MGIVTRKSTNKIPHFWLFCSYWSGSLFTSTSLSGSIHHDNSFLFLIPLKCVRILKAFNPISCPFSFHSDTSICTQDYHWNNFLNIIDLGHSYTTPAEVSSKILIVWLICFTLAGAPKENEAQTLQHIVQGRCRCCSLSLSLQDTLSLLGGSFPNAMTIQLCFTSLMFNQFFTLFQILFIFTSISIFLAPNPLLIQNPGVKYPLVNSSKFFTGVLLPAHPINTTSTAINIFLCNIKIHVLIYFLIHFCILES